MGESLISDVRHLKQKRCPDADIYLYRQRESMLHPHIAALETDSEERHMKRCKELRESWQTH